MAEQWAGEIAELKAASPLVVETPSFRQMYLGEWVIDSDKLVYRFNSNRARNFARAKLQASSFATARPGPRASSDDDRTKRRLPAHLISAAPLRKRGGFCSPERLERKHA